MSQFTDFENNNYNSNDINYEAIKHLKEVEEQNKVLTQQLDNMGLLYNKFKKKLNISNLLSFLILILQILLILQITGIFPIIK